MPDVDEKEQDVEGEVSSGLEGDEEQEVGEEHEEAAEESEDTGEEDSTDGDLNVALNQTRFENKQLKNQIAFLQGLIDKQQPKEREVKKSVLDKLDDSEPISKKELLEALSERDNAINEGFSKSQIDVMEAAFEVQHPDYKETLPYLQDLLNSDPSLHEALRLSKNPPALAYRLGQSHPEYIKLKSKKVASETTSKIKKNLSQVKPALEKPKKSKPAIEEIDWENASDKDIEERIQKVVMKSR